MIMVRLLLQLEVGEVNVLQGCHDIARRRLGTQQNINTTIASNVMCDADDFEDIDGRLRIIMQVVFNAILVFTMMAIQS